MNKQNSALNRITKESGLVVEVIEEGSGEIPNIGDTVLIHYILYLGPGVRSSLYDYDKHCYVDDLVDSTYEGLFSGPIKIIIGSETAKDGLYEEGNSIKGLDEALLEMKVGSKSRLIIPDELAYGSEGGSSFHTFHGYRTPPYRSLDMVAELMEIKDTTASAQQKKERAPHGTYP